MKMNKLNKENKKITVTSLFSGAGGLDLGFLQAGFDIIWANDIDKDACATYARNIGNHIICEDIKNIIVNEIPNSNIVIGGFPCQGFSVANLRRSIDDERNQLYKFFYSVIDQKKPDFFVAENVKGILNLGHGSVINQIEFDFQKAGYITSINLVNMADYGVPQTRQRVIILGQRKDIGKQMLINIPRKTNSKTPDKDGLLEWVSIKKAIEKFPDPDLPNTVANHIYSTYKVEYRNFTGHRKTDPDKPSPTILARGNGGGGVCAIPHYNGKRRLTIRESATIQTFPDDFIFIGTMNSCYRQIGNAVPVHFAYLLAQQFMDLWKKI